jgi:hypothetical protein
MNALDDFLFDLNAGSGANGGANERHNQAPFSVVSSQCELGLRPKENDPFGIFM